MEKLYDSDFIIFGTGFLFEKKISAILSYCFMKKNEKRRKKYVSKYYGLRPGGQITRD